MKQLRAKLIGDEEERAVSPVIGVILMVAITVILAAVIAAFVLDLGQSQSGQVNAAVSFSEDTSTENVTVQMTDSGNAEGVYVYNDSVEDESDDGFVRVLNRTGQSFQYNMTETSGLTAVAFDGDEESTIGNWP